MIQFEVRKREREREIRTNNRHGQETNSIGQFEVSHQN